jgi:hypothetical protein
LIPGQPNELNHDVINYTAFMMLAQKQELTEFERALYNQLCILFKTIARIRQLHYDSVLRRVRPLYEESQPAPRAEEAGPDSDKPEVS